MLKRLFAVLGCVLLVITCFVVPVGAEQVEVPINSELVGILTNVNTGYTETQFYLRNFDNTSSISLQGGETYYITDTQLNNAVLFGDSFVASSVQPYIPVLTVFGYDWNGNIYNIEVEYETLDGGFYKLLYYDGLEYRYLGDDTNYHTFYIYVGTNTGDYNAGYIDGYNAGYDVGYDAGLSAGDTQGYNRGYSAGLIDGDASGYARGYAQGLEDGDGITWTGLFTSAIEVPVNVLQGILNFEILGVNLWSFFGAIVALCVVLIVVKWVI